jgi:hypothetical protein
MKSSCRAPALSAIAFQPFVVATVIRIAGVPFASRTGRITPGITDRTSALFRSSRSSTGRSPSMILCSIFNLPSAARSLIQLFKTLLVLDVDAKFAVVIAYGDDRVLGIY